jgi:uncharacterized protein
MVRSRSAALRTLIALAVALFVALAGAPAARAAFTPPPLTEPIIDPAGKLSAPDKAKLEDELRGGLPSVAMAVFIVPDLAGENIDDVGYDTARAWKLGAAGKDNGVLLIIAPSDRKMRLEVGKGLEGDLPDLAANDILRQKVGPALKANDFAQAIAGGIDGVYSALHVQVTPSYARHPVATSDGGGSGTFGGASIVGTLLVLVVLFFIFRSRGGGGGGGIAQAIGFGIGASFLGGNGGGGGDWGGGGGGGGGDSGAGGFGGGGDFGGGGSSDSY